jgi:hypothetical protein
VQPPTSVDLCCPACPRRLGVETVVGVAFGGPGRVWLVGRLDPRERVFRLVPLPGVYPCRNHHELGWDPTHIRAGLRTGRSRVYLRSATTSADRVSLATR